MYLCNLHQLEKHFKHSIKHNTA